jgi:hypothetical protein
MLSVHATLDVSVDAVLRASRDADTSRAVDMKRRTAFCSLQTFVFEDVRDYIRFLLVDILMFESRHGEIDIR